MNRGLFTAGAGTNKIRLYTGPVSHDKPHIRDGVLILLAIKFVDYTLDLDDCSLKPKVTEFWPSFIKLHIYSTVY